MNLAEYLCTFSIDARLLAVCGAHTTDAYSNVGLTILVTVKLDHDWTVGYVVIMVE